VSRVVAIVMLLALTGSATGVFTLGEAACEEDCGDAADSGECCACPCTTRSVILACLVPPPTVEQVAGQAAVPAADRTPPDPEPDEILHVPRRAV
jgi:hypothetical protein